MGRQAVVVNSLYFFCGTLRHQPLLQTVLAREVQVTKGLLVGFSLCDLDNYSFPTLVSEPDAEIEGILVHMESAEDIARLSFFEAGYGFQAHPVHIKTPNGHIFAQMFQPDSLIDRNGVHQPWQFSAWQNQHGAAFTAMAQDYMAQFGVKSGSAMAARLGQMLARGASRVRAAVAAPNGLRFRAKQGDVAVTALREPYARFFAMEEIDVSFRRFDGSMSPKVTRAGFIACDAVTVLPYDPARDRVLVIEQFRAGPYLRGDPQPWQVEAIAGRIDAGETPEDAAKREAAEEAGLELTALMPVASYYPTPGCSAEFLYSFIALTDLPDDVAGVFGLEGEAEDIRGHVISFDRLMELVASGEISNAPTLLSAYWLARNREKLRAM
jgi:ADP-ribose pyrophosphatase